MGHAMSRTRPSIVALVPISDDYKEMTDKLSVIWWRAPLLAAYASSSGIGARC